MTDEIRHELIVTYSLWSGVQRFRETGCSFES